MAKVPTQVVIAAYHDEAAADEVADALKKAKRRLQIYYRNVAVIRKDAKGKVKIKETGDMSGGVGAGVGAVVGGALGILAGPAGLAAGAAAGAVIGGAGAALHDAGIPNERLEQIGSVLQPVLLPDQETEATAMAITADSRWLVLGGEDGRLRFWRLKIGDLIESACQAAGRNLNLDEWELFFPEDAYRQTCPEWPVAEGVAAAEDVAQEVGIAPDE